MPVSHSAFYGTPLEFLLGELGTRRLVIAALTKKTPAGTGVGLPPTH